MADAGSFEPDLPAPEGGPGGAAGGLEQVAAAAIVRDEVSALAGWAPASSLEVLNGRVGPLGGAVVELPLPRGVDPPTILPARRAGGAAFRPLVETYATVPYRDIDPTLFAAAAYVLMFGMMFGDVGDGLILLGAAFCLRGARRGSLVRLRTAWPILAFLGASACAFGLLYGEAFGPTGLVPVLWLAPLDQPVKLLVAGIIVGAVLLGVSFALGIANRWREGGAAQALWAPAGIAGASLFVGVALVVGGVYWKVSLLTAAGAALALIGLALAGVGLRAEAGPGGAGGVQAGVELFDLVVRLGSNVVSFARLAAFGLTHAALGKVVWDATTALWGRSPVSDAAAVLVFAAGHAVAFALEALVAGVQALRLEYYELFSRVFVGEGRPFRPWHLPLAEAAPIGEESP
ncbi:MAG TPA: V-type ATPase 116kDa subunit family protein [Actinomycetota bacterium]|nr:V-type ATPase 116kDa subunit family protein [Actinomycetota bacterium]